MHNENRFVGVYSADDTFLFACKTVSQVAEKLKLKESTVYDYIKRTRKGRCKRHKVYWFDEPTEEDDDI